MSRILDAMGRKQTLEGLNARLRDLTRQAADVGFIARGSVVQNYTTCGSRGCRCKADPPIRHGPYWQWTRSVGGKTVTKRLTPQEAKVYRRLVTNARRLDRLIAQMEDVSRRAAEILAADASTHTALRA